MNVHHRSSTYPLALACVLTCAAFPAAADEPAGVAVVDDAPRLIFRPKGTNGIPTFDDARATARIDAYAAEGIDRWLKDEAHRTKETIGPAAMRWILTGSDEDARRVIGLLGGPGIASPLESQTSNLHELALAYDWLGSAGLLDEAQRRAVENRLAGYLDDILAKLGRPGHSLWHRWTTISNYGMICALSLRVHPDADRYRARMLPLYREGIEALDTAQAWPGGYPYWIGNRSIPFALAALCWRSATGGWTVGDTDVRRVLEDTAYWHMYALRPDSHFIRYGDIFQGVNPDYFLQQPPQDFYAVITGNPYLAAFADHFRRFNKKGHTYRPAFAWYLPVAYPHRVPRPEGCTRTGALDCLRDLPQSRLFGRNATGLVIMRNGGWGPEATHVTFRAGHAMAHHGHWESGTFTVFKHRPLAVLSGVYGGYDKDARVGYYIRSIAANTLLVRMPGEVTDAKRPQYNDGGQRVVMPTGSEVSTLAGWRENIAPGKPWRGGVVESFGSEEGVFDYIEADLTCAYNSTVYALPGQKPKVSSVRRRLLYVREPEAVLIVDTIVKTDPSYRSKWLMHSTVKPHTASEEVLVGSADGGIVRSTDTRAVVTCGKGRLVVDRLLPGRHRWLKIGGPGYGFFVEKDTNDRDTFEGTSMTEGLSGKRLERSGNGWRIELEPLEDTTIDRFAVLVHIGSTDHRLPAPAPELQSMPGGIFRIRTGRDVVFVADGRQPEGRQELVLDPAEGVERVFVAGFSEGTEVMLTAKGRSVRATMPSGRACVLAP